MTMMKPMGDSGRGEYDAARLHSALLVTNANLGSAADDIVGRMPHRRPSQGVRLPQRAGNLRHLRRH